MKRFTGARLATIPTTADTQLARPGGRGAGGVAAHVNRSQPGNCRMPAPATAPGPQGAGRNHPQGASWQVRGQA